MHSSKKNILLTIALLIGALFAPASTRFSYTGPNRPPSTNCAPGQTVKLMTQKSNRDNNSCAINLVAEFACNDSSQPWMQYPALPFAYQACEFYPDLWIDQATLPVTTITLPATIDANLSCSMLGTNGWCRGGGLLRLVGNEPVAGQQITAVEGMRNGETFTCAGSTCLVLPVEGANSFQYWAVSSFGDTSLMGTSSLKLDTVPPQITAFVTGTSGLNGWYISNAIAKASASDANSGLALTEYRIDGGTWSSGSSLTVSSEGAHNLDFRATDQAGLNSTISLLARVDKTPPSITFAPTGTLGAKGWYTTPVSLLVNATDAFSGVASIETRLNSGSWTPGNSLVLKDGKHTVEARATDKAGNLSAVSAAETIQIQVDTATPSLTTSLSGTPGLAGWYVSNVIATANVSDATSGIALTEYRLDSGSWFVGDNLVVSQEGSHTVDFRTTDQAGLRSTASASFQVDKTGPSIIFAPTGRLGTNGWYTSSVSLVISATDVPGGVALIETRVDDGNWVTGGSRTLGDGSHAVEARAIDKAGNSTTAITLIKIDTMAPVLTASISGMLGNNDWYVSDATITAGVSDTTSGVFQIEDQVDNGQWAAGSAVTVSAEGIHGVSYRSTDYAGNQVSITRNFKLDKTQPASAFTSPLEGSSNAIARGIYTLTGLSTDAISGLSSAQLSFDNGKTWLPLSINSSIDWNFAWDTRVLPNGLFTILARAQDAAGNLEHTARVTLLVANQPPLVDLKTGNWPFDGESLYVRVTPQNIPVTEVLVRIACNGGTSDVKLFFASNEVIPGELKWDRRCGDGVLAENGDHPVTVKACDQVSNCASATGELSVPIISLPLPTWTPTSVPTKTPVSMAQPSPTPRALKVIAMPTIQKTTAPASPPATVLPVSTPELIPRRPASPIGVFALSAFALGFCFVALSDKRPRALHRLAQTIRKLE